MFTHVPYSHPAWIEIDLTQFKRNLSAIRKRIGKTKLCLPVKANAYGHGLIPIAQAAEMEKVDYLAVSCLKEAILLRQAKVSLPLLLFGAIHEEQIPGLLNYQLEVSITSLHKAQLLVKHCEALNKSCRVHVKIETGMQRTGMRPETALDVLSYLRAHPAIKIAGVYSHLATADKPDDPEANEQITRFSQFIEQHIRPYYSDILVHLAHSGGVCYYPHTYFDMVRPGLLCFGYFSSYVTFPEIKPFFTVKAKVAYFKVVAANQGISYGHTYHTTQQTRIITVPLGYGDGYNRLLSNRGQVLIRGCRYPIVGTICMDQFMVNIGHDRAYVGDEVVVIGEQDQESILLTDIATQCQTIPYEILCHFNDRLPRIYFDVK